MVASSFVRRHATGVTLTLFFASAGVLSVAPVPIWLKPLELFEAESPWLAFREAVLSQPESIPLPDQQDDQWAAMGGVEEADEGPDSEAPEPELPAKVKAAPNGVRPAWKPPPRPRFERYAARLGLKAAPLERPCLVPGSPSPCPARALDRFFAALERVEAGEPDARARVLHFGDSLIASDKIADRVRRRMQERFGSAGRGFLLAKRFNQFQRGQRSGRGSEGWSLDVITSSKHVLPDRHFGFSGASFTSERPGETLRFEPLAGSRALRIYHLAWPRGGALDVLADGQRVGWVQTRAPAKKGAVTSVELPAGTNSLVLRSGGRGARIYGVSLEAEVPGLVWSTLGLPGATSEVWLRPKRDEFVRLLRDLPPDLAVIMLGGNDGLMLSKKRTTAAAIEKQTEAFVERIRAAAPEVECLLISPLEAVRAKGGGRLIPKPEVPIVIDILRRVAEREGCAFWDMYASMGGKGSLKRWVRARLMLGDLIHPRSRGSDLLGEMMAEALMAGYDEAVRGDPESEGSGPSPRDGSGATPFRDVHP